MNLLPVGIVVRVSEKGKQKYHNTHGNPHLGVGQLTNIDLGTEYLYEVEWEIGANVYLTDEIEPAFPAGVKMEDFL